jgi:hypothetical protein
MPVKSPRDAPACINPKWVPLPCAPARAVVRIRGLPHNLPLFNFYLELPAKFHFAGTVHSVAAITRCTFTSSRKLAHPVETLRGPYVDPSHLQHLVFFYFDMPAKFHFAGTVHSVVAITRCTFTSSRKLTHLVETPRTHMRSHFFCNI